MEMMNVLGTTNGVALYNGSSVTCYPGSNQTDNGKLQLEFNMARFVTRVSGKNFCVTNPSFVITKVQSSAGIYQLRVSPGQASINGMDLIITDSIDVNPPEEDGTYYLALRLQRDDDVGRPDGRGNVLGDLVVGADVIFQGVCLTYLDTKDDTDKDILYLAQITYEDDDFTSIVEDGDKYGKQWAEDILCKWNDLIPSHKPPLFTNRPNLQELLYKIPDWYVSKDGDVEYEAIEWLPGRQNGTYTYDDYGTGKYGIQIKALSNSESVLKIKPSGAVEGTDTKLIYKVDAGYNGNVTGVRVNIGDNIIENAPDSSNGDRLRVQVPNALNTSSDYTQVYATNGVTLETQYTSGGTQTQTRLALANNGLQLSSGSNDLKELTTISTNVLSKNIGKTQLTYTKTNTTFKMMGTDTTYFDIVPKVDIENQARVRSKLWIGNSSTYGSDVTYIIPTHLHINGTGNQSNEAIDLIINNSNGDGKPSRIKVSNGLSWVQLEPNKIWFNRDETNNGEMPYIHWGTPTGTTDVYIKSAQETSGGVTSNVINISADIVKMNHNLTVTQDIRGGRVFGAVYNDYAEYFKKDENEEILPRDLVCIREDGLVHKVETEEDLDRIVGICSDTAGHILGGNEWKEEEKVVVGLVGKLYVNTDEDIKPGDLVEGTADNKVVKCYSRLSRLGIALEEAKDGKVLIIYNG